MKILEHGNDEALLWISHWLIVSQNVFCRKMWLILPDLLFFWVYVGKSNFYILIYDQMGINQ